MTHEIPKSSTPQQQGEIILYQPDETAITSQGVCPHVIQRV